MWGDRVNSPRHGEVWEQRNPFGFGSPKGQFSVMHVCGHSGTPLVTGYWNDAEGYVHDSIPLERFMEQFERIEETV